MGVLNKDGTLNKANYDKKLKKQQETFAQIDAAMSILEKLPDLTDTVLDMFDMDSLSLSLSPMGFLFNILRSLGVSEETLREWIIEILIYALPAVEVGLKASLLANLKSLVSCNSDARIPFNMRKKIGPVFTDIMSLSGEDDRGLIIPISVIDPEGMLDLSPFTAPGSTRYFGCVPDSRLNYTLRSVIEKIGLYEEEINNGGWLEGVSVTSASSAQMAKLARADDFNAFLWYALHKGNKMSPFVLSNPQFSFNNGEFNYNGKPYSLHDINGKPKSTLGGYTILKCNVSDEDPGSEFSAGSTFCMSDKGKGNISILIKSKSEYEQILVDISSDWFSCNWYVNKSNYVSNTGISKQKERNYEKEHGICNIKSYKETDLAGRAIKGVPECLQFTILPKPYIFIPTVTKTPEGKIAVVSQVKRLLFDADGTPNPKGRYSLNSESQTFKKARIEYNGGNKVVTGSVDGVDYEINLDTGEYNLKDKSKASELIECYPGLTVYEFNYDFVMGMKLFDPKVVCQRILENASNANYNVGIKFDLSFNKLRDKNTYSFVGEKQRLIEVVRQIIEEDEEINDCFFSFSNEQYEKMLNATEELRYGKMPYDNGYSEDSGIDMSEITNILSSYPENGTLEEQKYVLNKALEAATGIFNNIGSGGIESTNSSTTSSSRRNLKLNGNFGTDFLLKALESMVMAIVDAMLSPKVLLLLAVNQALMSNDSDKPITAEDLMSAMQNIIKSLVREVRDMIMEKVLDYIIKTLTPIALQIQALIVSEQLQAYLQIIKLLLAWFNKGMQVANGLGSALSSILSSFKSRFGDSFDGIDDVNSAYSGLANMDLPTVLDDIQYADIDLNDISESTPIIENC